MIWINYDPLVAPAGLRICPELKKPHRLPNQADGSFHLSMPDDRSKRPGIVRGRGAGGKHRNLRERHLPGCTRVHLVNRTTGRTLGDNGE